MKKMKLASFFVFLGICICALSPATLTAKISDKKFIAKDSDKTTLTVYYTPRPAVSGGTGKWQLIIIGPNGKKYKGHHIDMVTPPDKPRTFKIHNAKQGTYTIMVYVLKRTNNTPVDITSLATQLLIEPHNGKDNFAIPVIDFSGNRQSTIANDTAQAFYTLMKP